MKIPKQVIIEVTSRCNLRCRYCPSLAESNISIGDMSLAMFKSIVDRIDFDTVVIPWMNGEPLLHKDFLEMCQYLDSKKLKYYVTTNITIWKEEVFRHLLSDDSLCYQLIVSLDGLPDTGNIEACRPGCDEYMVLRHFELLKSMKHTMKSEKDLAVKICERGQDWQEIENYIQYHLADPVIDYVVVGKPLITHNEQQMRTAPCQYFDHNFMVIRHTGDLVICAYNTDASCKLKQSYGNVSTGEPLLAYYNNFSISKLRNDQDHGVYQEPCDLCGFAYTGMGYTGVIDFRDSKIDRPVYYQEDYYNKFFSLKLKRKPKEYYLQDK